MGETKLLYGDDFQFLPAENAAEAAEIIKSEFLKQTSIYGVEHTQVLTPFRVKSDAGAVMLNLALQDMINPSVNKRLEISSGNRTIRYRDKVMQTKNMETVSNGDIGFVSMVDKDADFPVTVTFSDNRIKEYSMDELGSIDLAYATTIHKSQGSEFDCVIIPVLSMFYVMLQRALIYTAITRAKKKVILVGQKRALFTAVHRNDTIQRNTILSKRIRDVFEKMKQKEQKAVKQEEVEELYFELQKQHRAVEASLNAIKGSIDQRVAEETAKLDTETAVKFKQYSNEIELLNKQFTTWKNEEISKIGKLRIIIPNELKDTYDFLSSL